MRSLRVIDGNGSFLGQKILQWGWGTLLSLLVCCSAMAQTSESLDETDTRAIMKANFLFHFAASNEWPEEVKEGDFYMSIIGNNRLYEELVDKYALKLIGAQPLKIQAFSTVQEFPLTQLHHLVYCEQGGDALKDLARTLKATPSLLVADDESGLESGAFINFVAVGNRIRYEINAEAAAKKGVLIGNKIMTWAVKPTQ